MTTRLAELKEKTMSEIGLWHAVENELPTRLLETSLKLEEHLETWLYEDPRLIAPSLLRVRRQVNLSGKKMDLLATIQR